MSEDLVQQVLKPERRERKAVGEVDGKHIKVKKKKYRTRGQRLVWQIIVSSDDTNRKKKESQLSHEQAHTRFVNLTDRYNLEEVEEKI